MEIKIQRLLNELPIGAVEVTRDHRIRHTNPEFRRFVGYSQEELQGISLLDITDSFDQELLEKHLNQLYQGETGYFEMETRYLRKDGSRVWGNPVRMIYPSPADTAVTSDSQNVLILVVDITERKKLEEQLRRSERMNSLGALAASVAHDFNNLLTVILSYLDLAIRDVEEPASLKDDLSKIKTAALHGANLTQQLMDYGRDGLGHVEAIDLNGALEEMVTMFQRLLPRGIQVQLDLGPSCPVIVTEKTNLHQIVMNLILNAADAIDDGGEILLQTRGLPPSDRSLPPVIRDLDQPFSALRVCDTGCGVPPKVQAKIFEPFFTTKGDEGTGLGLTTVYGIVAEDKGYIQVESEEGEGTCFTIYLPSPE